MWFGLWLAQVDAVHAALSAAGFEDIEIVVAETGWPSRGDSNEVGPGVENAQSYNGNLIKHLRSLVGTPSMPGKSVDTYIFALYDEDLKPGPSSERAFGIFKTDLTVAYDVGLAKTNQQVKKFPFFLFKEFLKLINENKIFFKIFFIYLKYKDDGCL